MLKITTAAKEDIVSLGLAGSDYEASHFLNTIYKSAAPTTSTRGNMRYGNLFLTVVGGTILRVKTKDSKWCEACLGSGIITVPDGTIRCPEC